MVCARVGEGKWEKRRFFRQEVRDWPVLGCGGAGGGGAGGKGWEFSGNLW